MLGGYSPGHCRLRAGRAMAARAVAARCDGAGASRIPASSSWFGPRGRIVPHEGLSMVVVGKHFTFLLIVV